MIMIMIIIMIIMIITTITIITTIIMRVKNEQFAFTSPFYWYNNRTRQKVTLNFKTER